MEMKRFLSAGCAYALWASLVMTWAVLLWRWLARYRVSFPADAAVPVQAMSACPSLPPRIAPPAEMEAPAPDPLAGWPRPLAWS